jgi:hypothetical protein
VWRQGIAIQMIESPSIRLHHHAADTPKNRSRGSLTTKIHAFVDASGLD